MNPELFVVLLKDSVAIQPSSNNQLQTKDSFFMPRFQNTHTVYKSSRSPYARGGNNQRRKAPSKHGQYIDPARFVRVATPVTAEDYTPEHMFADFKVDPRLHANIAAKGYIAPTPIQDKTIALGLDGKDVIGIASTGTGKTAAFAVPILHRLMSEKNARALIVAPTRELAQQIEEEARQLGKGGGFTGALLIGGSAMVPQLRDLRGGPRIVIGTPGRIKDHIERRTLDLGQFNIVVLDEVDRMLDMGFVDDVRLLLKQLATDRQSFYFSATMDARVNTLIQAFSPNAITISLKASDTSENVHQDVVNFSSKEDKMSKLHDILIDADVKKAIVFDETQRNVERLSKELLARGFNVDDIHGGKTQGQRQRALAAFKQNKINVLVATDVAARGIDVSDITHVINFSQPHTYDDYVHRIGRAGRAGKTGYALTFVEGGGQSQSRY
jgi:ATP-dependent RNA helicase RhlE